MADLSRFNATDPARLDLEAIMAWSGFKHFMLS